MDILNFLIDGVRALIGGMQRLLGVSKPDESPRHSDNPLDGFSAAIGIAILAIVTVVMLYYYFSGLLER